MGMAASQARYLALVARKSNCEYEGQQINQARLLLSNQSANLFNQMLGLTVPVPPSTQDFTKTQYSYSDGVNNSVIDSWKQLSNDPEYNYVVTSHYYTDIYTGSVKKMTDPQVQVSNSGGSTSMGNWSDIKAAYDALTVAQAVRDSSYTTWQTTKSTQERVIDSIKRQAAQNNNKYEIYNNLLYKSSPSILPGYTAYRFSDTTNVYNINIYNDPDSIVDTTVTSWNTAMSNAYVNSANANASAQAVNTTAADAQPFAESAAAEAVDAAKYALEIAQRSGDETAIAIAQQKFADAEAAYQKAQNYNTYYLEEYTNVINNYLTTIAADNTLVQSATVYDSNVGNAALEAAQAAYDAAALARQCFLDNVDPSDPNYTTWQFQLDTSLSSAAGLLSDIQTAIDNNDLPTLKTSCTNINNWIVSTINTLFNSNVDFSKASRLGYVKNISADAYNIATDAYNLITPTILSAAKDNSPEYDEAKSILQAIRDQVKLGILSLEDVNTAITEYYSNHPGLGEPTLITNIEDILDYSGMPTFTDLQKEVLHTYGISNYVDSSGNLSTDIVLAAEIEELNNSVWDGSTAHALYGYPLTFADPSVTTNADYLQQIADAQQLIDVDYNTYEVAQTIYENALGAYNALNRPTYIGNSELTLLGTLTTDQETELLQVVKDLRAQGITSHILDCFDMDGTYLGGVYSFQLGGNTYYTTYADLNDAYASNIYSNNYIDDQFKMPYYNASYVTTRVDQQRKALLETDGSGRFTSIRFEDDSITYALSTETVTDNEAYQDAMNKYYYENAKYDKMIQDINAKTSIIQREDQELELRLKQLDTEQNALKTEMEAVAKVVKDNVDASFKTFGG